LNIKSVINHPSQ